MRLVELKGKQESLNLRLLPGDSRDFYALGASIKDLGDKLSLLNKVEDPANVARLRAEFQTIWASGNPL